MFLRLKSKLCAVPEFPRISGSLPVFVSCQMDLGDPCQTKIPSFPCFCDFCTGLLYLCSSTQASQIYLLLFLKGSILGYICVNLKTQMMAVKNNICIFHPQCKMCHLKQLLNCVQHNFQENFMC